jgi:signal transduction histidine kinase
VTGQGETDDDRHQVAGFAKETLQAVEPIRRPVTHGHRQRQRIEEVLDRLKQQTGASSAFVLSLLPGPTFEKIAGSFPKLDRETQQRLGISPIGDVLRQKELLAVDDVSAKASQFKHLLAVLPMASFAGLRLPYADRADYALFLIGETPHQLHDLRAAALHTEALLIGHYIAEERLDEVITENQGLLLTGFLSDSLLHEIKNELQALDDFAAIQVLLGKRHSEDYGQMKRTEVVEFKRSVLGVEEVSERLNQLVLLFRNLAGRSPDQHVDPNRTIERLAETLKPFADDRNTRLILDLAPDLPGLKANPKLIEQPLLNLMINAIEQVALSGGAHRRVRISSQHRPDTPYPTRITVADNGRGVHTLHREKIFDLFFTTKDGGTGLGLYISRFFIERLGGRLLLGESVMFSGSEFLIELP